MPAPEYPTAEELASLLADYLDVTGHGGAAIDYAQQCAETAVSLLTAKLGTATTVPVDVYTQAFLLVGEQLYRRRRSWTTTDPMEMPTIGPVRTDPMSAADPLLRPYLGAGIG